jgi:hypothetical protein
VGLTALGLTVVTVLSGVNFGRSERGLLVEIVAFFVPAEVVDFVVDEVAGRGAGLVAGLTAGLVLDMREGRAVAVSTKLLAAGANLSVIVVIVGGVSAVVVFGTLRL